jgi:integrase
MTRYPKDGKGAKWNPKQLDSITSLWKGDTISDGGGLSGTVRVSADKKISIRFQYIFRIGDKTSFFQCGTYPLLSLASIRKNRDDAKKLVSEGVDPRHKKVADKIEAQAAVIEIIRADEKKRSEELTFSDLYETWIKDGVSRSDENKYITQTFGKHAIPTLGNIELRNLSEHHLRALYRKIILDGKVATSVELSKDIGQMLRWAEKRKPWRALLVDGNPSELVEIAKLVPADYTKERTRKLSVEEIVKLKTIFESSERAYGELPNKNFGERPLMKASQLALWICLGSLCRIGELLMTEWKHVDFKKRTWFIPAANTKGERGKKRDQVVYLSDFTLDKFMQLKAISGDVKWVFPASSATKQVNSHVCLKSVSKQVGDRQIQFKDRTKPLTNRVNNNTLVLGEDEWTPHDLRRTGATMMQQLKPRPSRDVINLCQNHVIGTKVDRVYLLDDYADEKRDAWFRLGERLETILAN